MHNAKCIPFHSILLVGADIDVLCVAPRLIDREQFTNGFADELRQLDGVRDLRVRRVVLLSFSSFFSLLFLLCFFSSASESACILLIFISITLSGVEFLYWTVQNDPWHRIHSTLSFRFLLFLQSIPEAYVPVIKFNLKGVEVRNSSYITFRVTIALNFLRVLQTPLRSNFSRL